MTELLGMILAGLVLIVAAAAVMFIIIKGVKD